MITDVQEVAYGRPATEALAAAVAAAKEGRPLHPVTVVVGSNFVGLSARRALVRPELGLRGLANVQFVTPFRLAELLGADQLLGTRPLTKPVLGAAVRRTLATEPGRRARGNRGGGGCALRGAEHLLTAGSSRCWRPRSQRRRHGAGVRCGGGPSRRLP